MLIFVFVFVFGLCESWLNFVVERFCDVYY